MVQSPCPLVNVCITMEHHHFLDMYINHKWTIFNSYVPNYQRVNLLQSSCNSSDFWDAFFLREALDQSWHCYTIPITFKKWASTIINHHFFKMYINYHQQIIIFFDVHQLSSTINVPYFHPFSTAILT